MTTKWIATKINSEGGLTVTAENLTAHEVTSIEIEADFIFLPDPNNSENLNDLEILNLVRKINKGRVFEISDTPNRFTRKTLQPHSSCSGVCFPETQEGVCWCICSEYFGGKYYWIKCHKC